MIVETKSIFWLENEERMFEEWLEDEKKEWELYRLGAYEELTLGISQKRLQSVWSQELYQVLFPYLSSFSSLRTYVITDDEEKSCRYLVDLGYEAMLFRMFITFNKEEFSVEFTYKAKEEDYYFDLEDYVDLDEELKCTFKKSIHLVLNVYDELKKFVQSQKTIRLLLLTRNLVLEERSIYKVRNFAQEHI